MSLANQTIRANINQLQSLQTKGFLFAALGAFLTTINFVSAKIALGVFNPETFSFLWTLSAAGYALLILIVARDWRSLILPIRSLKRLILIGVVNGIGALLTWKGLAYLDPAMAAFLWRFHPVLTILLGVVFLNERFYPVELLPIGLMIAGAFISVTPQWSVLSVGVLITLFAAFNNSLQMFLVKITVSDHRPEAIVFYRNAVAAVLLGSWALITGTLDLSIEVSPIWIIPLVGSLLGETLSFTFLFRSLAFWNLSRTIVLRTAEPLLVILWSYLVFESLPGPTELVGGGLILCGALAFSLFHMLLPAHRQHQLDFKT